MPGRLCLCMGVRSVSNVMCQPFFLALIGHGQTKMAAHWKAWRQAGEVFVLQLPWYWWSNLALHLCLGYPLMWSAFWHLHWRLPILAFMDGCQKSRPNGRSLSSACKSLSVTGSWVYVLLTCRVLKGYLVEMQILITLLMTCWPRQFVV